jgi:hypothetical protein
MTLTRWSEPGLAEIVHELTKVKIGLTGHCPDPVERVGGDEAVGKTIALLGGAIARRACGNYPAALTFVFQASRAHHRKGVCTSRRCVVA